MGGGLLQLVAYGAQDVYLTGNPQITFWKVSYRRYTNFSMETIQQSMTGSFNPGTRSECVISRNGDLLHKVYVSSHTRFGDKLIQDVEIQIGGQRIDKHINEWMMVWDELTTPASKADGLMVMKNVGGNTTNLDDKITIMVPLKFWFCRNPGLAIPLIALQYHEVKLIFTWNITNSTPSLWCDYIFLDTDERRRMAQNPHEYLIDQVQTQTTTGPSTMFNLNFNHPVKELIFTTQPIIPVLDLLRNPSLTTTYKCNLELNGQDRFASQSNEYFQLRQPYDYHTAIPNQNTGLLGKASLFFQINSFININNVFENGINNLTAMAFGGGLVTSGSFMICNYDVATNTVTASSNAVNLNTAFCLIFNRSDLRLDSNTTQLFIFLSGSQSEENAGFLSLIEGFIAENINVGNIIFVSKGINLINGDLFRNPLDNEITTGAHLTIRNLCFVPLSATTSQMTNLINVYSFSLRPEEHQPSGTCNFSRIDSAVLKFDTPQTVFNIYAVNYNVLRIMSGMGGLAYSN